MKPLPLNISIRKHRLYQWFTIRDVNLRDKWYSSLYTLKSQRMWEITDFFDKRCNVTLVYVHKFNLNLKSLENNPWCVVDFSFTEFSQYLSMARFVETTFGFETNMQWCTILRMFIYYFDLFTAECLHVKWIYLLILWRRRHFVSHKPNVSITFKSIFNIQFKRRTKTHYFDSLFSFVSYNSYVSFTYIIAAMNFIWNFDVEKLFLSYTPLLIGLHFVKAT